MKNKNIKVLFGYKPVALCLFFLITSIRCFSQITEIDSLKQALKTTSNDSARLILFSEMRARCDVKELPKYILPAIKICIKHTTFPAKKNRNTSFYAQQQGSIYGSVGVFYFYYGNFTKALEADFKALNIFEQLNNDFAIANISINIANIYFTLDNDKEALKHITVALRKAKKVNNKSTISDCYDIMSRIKQREGKNKEALLNIKKSIELKESDNDLYGLSISYASIGDLYRETGQDSIGIAYIEKGLKLEIELNDSVGAIYSYNSIANYELKKGNLVEAKKNAVKSHQMALILKYPLEISKSSEILGKIYAKEGNYKEAYNLQEVYKNISDSLLNEKTRNSAVEKNLQYEFEKKELNTKLQQQKALNQIIVENEQRNAIKNTALFLLLLLLIVIVVISYVFYRNNKQKQAIRELEKNALKQKLLLTQMSPHFIFNSVNNIQGLIINEKTIEAVNYLDRFSELTRQILENSTETYISFIDEVQMIKNYLEMQQLLYNKNFKYDVLVDGIINQDLLLVPPMLTQPFIENAIKHGLANKKHGGEIKIHYSFIESKLCLEIVDNGTGFIKKEKSNNHKSLAISITKERLMGYNNKEAVIFFNNITNTENNIVGAQVLFEIPYIYDE